MTLGKSLMSGLAGAVVLTVLHETARKVSPNAPRMDLLGMRILSKGFEAADQTPPPAPRLHKMALAGEIVSNSLYYSLVATGQYPWLKGAVLGLAAGLGGITLPGQLGLGHHASSRTHKTKVMTAAWYLLGGLAAAAVAQSLRSNNKS